VLSNLPVHNSVDISFIAAMLDSWDSTNGSPAPDFLNLLIDNVVVAQYTYNNASGSVKQIGGGTLVGEYVQFDSSFFYSDTVVDFANDPALAFAHSASTLRIGFQAAGNGFQFGTDESWGIDALRVDVNDQVAGPTPVPEPSSLALLGLGLAAAARRRRSRRGQ
jgi:hypothetical protein